MLHLPAHLTVMKLKADDLIECHLCEKQCRLHDMQNHVGKDILFSMWNIDEKVLLRLGAKVGDIVSSIKDLLLKFCRLVLILVGFVG